MAAKRGSPGDVRLMVRIAQLYYGMHLSQAEVGQRLGLSRFQVGRLLDRAVAEEIVRIDVVHPAARLLELEDRLIQRFGLGTAVVADVPATTAGQDADDLAREAVGEVAADLLAEWRPAGVIGVSWGRTMLAVARHLRSGWATGATIVQLNGAASRSDRPTRATDILERFASTSGGSFRGLPAPAIVGSPELREALLHDPAIAETIELARTAGTAVFGLGIPAPDSPHLASGFVDADEQGTLRSMGAAGDVIGRFLDGEGRVAWPDLDSRTVGLSLDELRAVPKRLGVAAGSGRGPIALAAIRAGVVTALACDDATAEWVLSHG